MKKKSGIKLMALTMALIMCFGLVACGAAPAATTPPAPAANGDQEPASPTQSLTAEPVVLTMYLLGDRTPDFDEVFAKINEKMQKEINTTLDVKFMSWSEYEQKYPLVFASGEDFDIIYTADWCFYNAQATKQGFYEITREELETYAPQTAATIYPEAWEQAKVNGKVYMLPMNYKELTSYVYLVRGDLMDKYGIESVETLDEVEAYLDAIAQNEKGMIPLDIGSDFDATFMFSLMWNQAVSGKLESVGPWQLMGCTSVDDTEAKITSEVTQPEFLDVITRLKDWKDRGFWSKSAAVNTQNNKESFAAGKSAMGLMNVNNAKSEYAAITEAHPEWDVRVFDAQGNAPAVVQSYLANGMCIFSKSKNPQRALMALDLLRCDKEINELFNYGIEGKHWQAVGDNKLVSLEASSGYPYDGNCNWGIRNDALWRSIEGGIPGLDEMTAHWMETAASGKFATFNFNDENVKNEVAALTEIFGSDFKLLCLGFTNDPAADVAKLQKKMEAAGAEKLYSEMQSQAQAFLDSAK